MIRMKSPLHSLSLLSILSPLVSLVMIGGVACSGEPSDEETTAAEAGDGDGDGDDMSGGESGSASGSAGDGDGDGEGEETDPDCPAGTFDCPCDDGTCVEGLTCGGDGLCSLGGDPTTTTGDPTDTGDPTTETTTTTAAGMMTTGRRQNGFAMSRRSLSTEGAEATGALVDRGRGDVARAVLVARGAHVLADLQVGERPLLALHHLRRR